MTRFNSRENVPGSKCSVWPDLKMGPEQLVPSQPRHKWNWALNLDEQG